MLLATEEIGHIIEEPFGIHDDRPKILPLQRYCDIIANDLKEQNRLVSRAVVAKREQNPDDPAVAESQQEAYDLYPAPDPAPRSDADTYLGGISEAP